jgi:sec-independent protein translocase protein TatC
MKKNEKKMSLVEHLKEIRMRLIWCCLSTFVSFVAFFFLYENLLGFLVRPLIVAGYGKIVTMSVAENFLVHVKVAGAIAMLINFPFYAIQVYLFVAPGFSFNDRLVRKIFFTFVLLFVSGMACFYFYIFPGALKFFLEYSQRMQYIESAVRLSEYISFVLYCLIGFGLVFQMPLVLVLLGGVGVVSVAKMRGFRKFAVPIIFFVAAVATPPDVMSQVILGLIMMCFYELTMVLIWLIERRRVNLVLEEKVNSEGLGDE